MRKHAKYSLLEMQKSKLGVATEQKKGIEMNGRGLQRQHALDSANS
jgi:hypothetical protein